MSNRRITAILLLLVLAVASASAARAPGAADADHAMHAMDLRMRALTAARRSLQQSENRHDDREADAVRDIADADVIVLTDAVKVFTVAFFVKGMACPDDVGFAQKQFALVVKSFVATADEQLLRVNDSLRNITTPAAIAEATHIRDVIVDLREFLQPFAASRR